MTKLSTYGARVHGAGALWVTWYCSLAEGGDVLRALRMNMLSGLTLEAVYGSGSSRFGVGGNDGVVACSRLHNHLQSSGEHNMSSAHSRSSSSVNPSPTSLS